MNGMRGADLRRVVIVGGSLAGLSAAKGLRQAGYEGAIIVVGREPDPPYKRPPLSKQLLVGLEPPGGRWLRVEPELNVDFRLGTAAVGLNLGAREVSCADGSRIPFDGLVIATGADPVNPWRDSRLTGVRALRTLADCAAVGMGLRTARSVAVVGAGFIGAEVAAAARKLSVPATLIDVLPTPHAQVLGQVFGEACAALHVEHGTSLRMSAAVVGLEADARSGAVVGVRLDSGEAVEADLVVVGIGVRPATAWLQGSGVALDNGVVCDATCAVLDESGAVVEGVTAAGDVARWHNPIYDEVMRVEHWDNASAQGRAAGRRLLGMTEPYELLPYFWSDQYDAKIQVVGAGRPEDDIALAEGDISQRRFVLTYARGGRVVGAAAMNMPQRVSHYRLQMIQGRTIHERVH
jgi:NADPH-dependent 2,4-dienoyl-CoA reductase/sulfur reductase-like enzyme